MTTTATSEKLPDERWNAAIESHIAREDNEQLWRLAKQAPPIVALRILKYLLNDSWNPKEEHQQEIFRTLATAASKCNLAAITPQKASSLTLGLGTEQVTATRITSTGEYAFIVNEKATYIELRRMLDFEEIERVRIDMYNGKPCATLAMCITRDGDRLAVLSYIPATMHALLRIITLFEGKVLSEAQYQWASPNMWHQVPSMSFAIYGDVVVVFSESGYLRFIDAISAQELSIKSLGPTADQSEEIPASAIYRTGQCPEWRSFGRSCMQSPESRAIWTSIDDDSVAVIFSHKVHFTNISEPAQGKTLRLVRESRRMELGDGGAFAVFINEYQTMRLEANPVFPAEQPKALAQTAWQNCIQGTWTNHTLLGLGSIMAINRDSEYLASTHSETDAVDVWHLPDGRYLGALGGIKGSEVTELTILDDGSVVAATRFGDIYTWQADSGCVVLPWRKDLIGLVYQPVEEATIESLKKAEQLADGQWLSPSEQGVLAITLIFTKLRLSQNIELDLTELEALTNSLDIQIDEQMPAPSD